MKNPLFCFRKIKFSLLNLVLFWILIFKTSFLYNFPYVTTLQNFSHPENWLRVGHLTQLDQKLYPVNCLEVIHVTYKNYWLKFFHSFSIAHGTSVIQTRGIPLIYGEFFLLFCAPRRGSERFSVLYSMFYPWKIVTLEKVHKSI